MSTYDISTRGGRLIGWAVGGDNVDYWAAQAAEYGGEPEISVHDDQADQQGACRRCCSPDTRLTAKGVCADTLTCEQIQPTLDAMQPAR